MIGDTPREKHPRTVDELLPENNFCDLCNSQVAIYIERKRRRGRLTRDQVCAGCVRKHGEKYGTTPRSFIRLRYGGM